MARDIFSKSGRNLMDEMLMIPHGQFSKLSGVNKFGENADIGTTEEDIWDGGAVWVPPTTARIHNIASTDTADTSAGTGARTVEVQGLDANYVSQTETVTLNGTSNVATTGSYVIIHRMKVLTAGSGGVNAGTITATAVTDATVTAQITIGKNQTLMAIYQVPAGKSAYMVNYYYGLNRANTNVAYDLSLKIKPLGSVFQTKHVIGGIGAGSSSGRHDFRPYFKIASKSIIKLSAIASGAGCDITGGFDLILVDY